MFLSFTIVLVPVLLGGVTAAVLSHQFALYRADREYRLRKLEDLLVALQYHRLIFVEVYEQYLSASQGRSMVSDALTFRSNVLQSGISREMPHFTMLTLAEVYFPDLYDAVNRVVNGLGAFHALDGRLFAPQQEVPIEPKIQGDVNRISSDYDRFDRELRDKVRQFAENLRRGSFISWLAEAFRY